MTTPPGRPADVVTRLRALRQKWGNEARADAATADDAGVSNLQSNWHAGRASAWRHCAADLDTLIADLEAGGSPVDVHPVTPPEEPQRTKEQAASENVAVRAFIRTVRERATRLQRLYRSPRAEAIHEALETSASEVGE